MHSWRRILAIILIMVFAPATVLAAMPLQLCLGNDGHRAIESLFAGDHHQDSAHSKSRAASQTSDDAQGSAVADSIPDCRDVALQAVTQVSSRTAASGDHADNSKYLGGSFPAFPQTLAVSSLCDSGEQGHPAHGAPQDPHLATLATIVLLN